VKRALAWAAIASATALVWTTAGADAAGPLVYKDITAAAGIHFVQNNGAFGGKLYPEELGSGVIFLDFDSDGWQDILLVNARNWPGRPGPKSHAALYRNRRNGTFADVSKGSGLDVELYGVGGAAGDYDNDGRIDVFITAYGGGHLFRNLGAGKFQDVTATAGVADPGWSTSALWVDYDKDGRLDLFVARYINWDVASDVYCTQNGKTKGYCGPTLYKPNSPRLYHNRGGGSFDDVTARAGLAAVVSKGLGVAMLDYDGDGRIDLFLANDTQPNQLFRNAGDGTFSDVASRAGIAVSESGAARAGMGVDAADYDGSGWPSLVIGNFSNETMSLYHNEGRGLFIDDGPRSGVARETLLSLTFACFFFDYDLDGALDIFAANGHVFDEIPAYMSRVTYKQFPHLFRNLGQRRFQESITKVGPDLGGAIVGRGAGYADIDNDGDLDLLVTEVGGPARLYRNDGGTTNQSLRVKLAGTMSNRDGIGARVEITRLDGSRAWALVKTGSSYASQSELPVTFGLGQATAVKSLSVQWPSGRMESVGGVSAGVTVVITEGAGITQKTPLVRARN
jgi:enediyne biosynthesis protein E4